MGVCRGRGAGNFRTRAPGAPRDIPGSAQGSSARAGPGGAARTARGLRSRRRRRAAPRLSSSPAAAARTGRRGTCRRAWAASRWSPGCSRSSAPRAWPWPRPCCSSSCACAAGAPGRRPRDLPARPRGPGHACALGPGGCAPPRRPRPSPPRFGEQMIGTCGGHRRLWGSWVMAEASHVSFLRVRSACSGKRRDPVPFAVGAGCRESWAAPRPASRVAPKHLLLPRHSLLKL